MFPADAAADCPELDELERFAAGEEVESHKKPWAARAGS